MKENRRPEGYQEAPLAYDAVWAVALGSYFSYRYSSNHACTYVKYFYFNSALNKTMRELSKHGDSLKSFTYTNDKIRYEIYKAMNSTEFLGISVSEFFGENILNATLSR